MSEGRFIEGDDTAFPLWPMAPEPHRTTCRHTDGDCDRCGTTDRRDVAHTTERGQGVVARLREKKRC